VSKDICVPANHCLILAIYESTRSAAGVCCGNHHHDEGWYYKVTYNGNTIKEGNDFQSSDYLQFGGGCQIPSEDKSAHNSRSLLTADDTSSAEYSYVAVDEEGRRYFPRSPDISELGQSVRPPLPDLPDCTKQGRTGCIVNPSLSRGASFHLPSISYQQNPACVNGACTLAIAMSKQNVDFTEGDLIPSVYDIGFTEAKTRSLPGWMGTFSYGIAAGDLDGDGMVDLATNHYIFLNSGNKAIPFKEAIDLPDTGRVRGIKLADMDNDGILDIVFISYNTEGFVLFNNKTDLNFSRRVPLDIGGLRTFDLSVGDVNNDGWLDIIVGTTSGIILFLNMKNDTFDKIVLPQLELASQVAFVDIDNDKRIDIISLASSDFHSGNVRVFMNKYGNGTFFEKDVIVIPGEYRRFCVGDMNGDEFPDLILAKYSYSNGGFGSVELLVNNAGTGFDESNVKILLPRQGSLAIFESIEAGDLNGDGMIDLVFGTSKVNFMILNKGGGNFTEAIDLPGGSTQTEGIVIADVNNDSALDIVFANIGEDKVLLNLLPIESFFGAALSLPGGERYTRSMAFADVNDDGFNDIVVGSNSGANQILLNKRDGSFDAIDFPTSHSFYPNAMAVGDIVGNDKLPDIVVCGDNGCDILRNNGNLMFDSIDLLGWESHAVAVGDVNNDSFIDVIIGGYTTSNFFPSTGEFSSTSSNGDVLLINNKDGTFTPIDLPGYDVDHAYSGTESIALADFNKDNR
jgi:hypothetical protein